MPLRRRVMMRGGLHRRRVRRLRRMSRGHHLRAALLARRALMAGRRGNHLRARRLLRRALRVKVRAVRAALRARLIRRRLARRLRARR
jgi:hypothetical protein